VGIDTERIRGLVDPDESLVWKDMWVYSSQFLEMWASWKYQTSKHGELRQMLVRSDGRGPEKALPVSLGILPKAKSGAGEEHKVRTDRAGGFLHFLPTFELSENMLVTSPIMVCQPWFAPSLAGFIGYPERNPEDKQWHITYEHPIQYTDGEFSEKIFYELYHLERFCTDYLLWKGVPIYERIDGGGDPPDFVCVTDSGRVGVECTQFTIADRRRAYGLFRNVRTAILEHNRISRKLFANLLGLAVYLRFEDDGGAWSSRRQQRIPMPSRR
jgi:hypothetical protein